MDASLLLMGTRESELRELLAVNDRASIDESRPKLEVDARCRAALDLFSGISQLLQTINRYRNNGV